jgi:hypothetical protein
MPWPVRIVGGMRQSGLWLHAAVGIVGARGRQASTGLPRRQQPCLDPSCVPTTANHVQGGPGRPACLALASLSAGVLVVAGCAVIERARRALTER